MFEVGGDAAAGYCIQERSGGGGRTHLLLALGSFLTKLLVIVFFTESFFFSRNSKISTPEKTGLHVFQFFREKNKLRYKGVENWAAVPLELWHHSRAHET